MTERVSEPVHPHARPSAAEELAGLLRSGALGARLITAARRGAEQSGAAADPGPTREHGAGLGFAPPVQRAIG